MKEWIPAWGYRETDFSLFPLEVENETQRVWFKNNLSASNIRFRFSNRYGREPLRIAEAAAALCNESGVIIPGTECPVFFDGKTQLCLEEGESCYCDPIALSVEPGQWVSISIYVREKSRITCAISSQSNVITRMSCRKGGNFCHDAEVSGERFLGGAVEFLKLKPLYNVVAAAVTQAEGYCEDSEQIRTVVAFGDSITQHGNWSEALAQRLYDAYPGSVSLVNRGICGNRVVHDASIRSKFGGYFGEAALERFEEDVYKTSPARVDCVLFEEGVNDVIQPYDATCPQYEKIDAERVLAAYRDIVRIAHSHNSTIYGSTLMPFCGFNSVWNSDSEMTRTQINEGIHTESIFDGVLEFEKVTADPQEPWKPFAPYNCGDHIHPSPAGGQAIADSVDLKIIMEKRGIVH